ncbi:hypothetical protein [Streptomyces sp. NPDC005955]|uniref:hypothetical protein n=1 Tax=Streptomyces sp. NPDC005955 TaxID=3364738 RepID=UPI0036B3C880
MPDTAPPDPPGQDAPAVGVDALDRWGERVAQWAAPEESVLAAQTTRAYAAGGRTRRDLFRTGAHAPGALDGGLATVLPQLLDALAYAADALKTALGSQYFSNGVAVTTLAVALRERSGRCPRTADGPHGSEGGEAGEGEAATATTATTTATTTAAPNAEAVAAALRMYERLRARRVDDATAEELTAALVSRLLTTGRPQDVGAFLDALVATEAPSPAPERRGPLRRFAGALRRRPGRRADRRADDRPDRAGDT